MSFSQTLDARYLTNAVKPTRGRQRGVLRLFARLSNRKSSPRYAAAWYSGSHGGPWVQSSILRTVALAYQATIWPRFMK
jgi:hypothetical protein